MKYVLIVLALAALTAFWAGCGDDDGTEVSDTPTMATDGTPEPIRRTESLAALRTYLADVGLDGNQGDLTDPVGCEQIAESDANGDFCVLETSTFAAALALILVADVEDRDDSVWQVRVVLEDGSWQVTEAVKFESE